MMTSEEIEIHKAIYKNSLLFFNDFVSRLLSNDNGEEDIISNDLVVLVVSSLQTSMELALKAAVLEKDGIKEIVKEDVSNKTHVEILKLFKENKLQTKAFWKLKKHVSDNLVKYNLNEFDIDTMSDFQSYRNGIMHLSYNFVEGDYFDLKYEIVYFFTNILSKVLSSEKDKESLFLYQELGKETFGRLAKYKPYQLAMERLVTDTTKNIYTCIVCGNRTYDKDSDYCDECLFEGDLAGQFIDCKECGKKKSVTFDHLNIANNNNIGDALCLNCNTRCKVYKCPVCENAYELNSARQLCNNNTGCNN